VLNIVDGLVDAVLHASAEQIKKTATAPQPQVHIMAEDMDTPYLGYVVCRRFYRGEDAAAAIAGLGLLPSVLYASRLLVLWEESDLCAALQLPGEPAETGLMIVDATLDGHVLRWYPFRAEPAPARSGDMASVRWGNPVSYQQIPLLPPVEALLATWRAFHGGDLEQAAAQLQQAGYDINWITARHPESPRRRGRRSRATRS
jgi:hypothetical protein